LRKSFFFSANSILGQILGQATLFGITRDYFSNKVGLTDQHSRKNGDFLTSFSLSNKSTYLANKISQKNKRNKRQSRENQNFAAFISIFFMKTPNDICIVKEF
jgi:hypothetical protein